MKVLVQARVPPAKSSAIRSSSMRPIFISALNKVNVPDAPPCKYVISSWWDSEQCGLREFLELNCKR